jgi:Ca-activated chloride channel family protein
MAQQPRFRISAEGVLVDVQVREGARPVPDLTAADFELRDSGVVQKIQAVSFEDVPLSLLLALDVSTSVRGDALDRLKQAARAAAAALGKDDQAAVLTFSEQIGLKTGWTRDRAVLDGAIDSLTASGATALRDGIFTALSMRNDAIGRTLLVVFSDGEDTSSWLEPPEVMQAARDTDIVVYGVTPRRLLEASDGADAKLLARQRAALTRRFDSAPTLFPQVLLERITEETGGEILYVSQSRDLPAAFARIVGEFKSRYLLSYTPTGVPAKGWHPLTVKVKRRNVTVRARSGYSAQ